MSGDHNMNQFNPDWDTVRAYEDRFTELFDEVQQLRAGLKLESENTNLYKNLYEELKEKDKMRFEPPPEVMEYIVRYELIGHYDQMKKNLKKRQETDEWCAIFSTDKEEDIRQIKKMIKSLKRVLDYYGAFDEER